MLRFSICDRCLTEAAITYGGQTGIDCRRFIRDAIRGAVVVKGISADFDPCGPCLSERDLENFCHALTVAGMQGAGPYYSAVKIVVERLLPEGCDHCDASLAGAVTPPGIPTRDRGTAIQLPGAPGGDSDTSVDRLGDSSENGYRIGHAQKSLSLVLKHMWCHGYLTTTPPVCVIDRIILDAARNQGGGTSSVPWTRVNSVRMYREHLAICKRAARGAEVAIWELFTFKGLGVPSSVTTETLEKAKRQFLIGDSFAAKPGATRDEALRGALKDVRKSAFGHNPTWGPTADPTTRTMVHETHGKFKVAIYKEWESGKRSTEEHFINDIESLVTQMNGRFGRFFR